MTSQPIPRILATACHFIVFVSAVIVTGIVSYLIVQENLSGLHIIWEIVIATVTFAVYITLMLLPLYKHYGGQLVIVHFFFFALWLTTFVFTAIDWSGNKCSITPPALSGPPESGKCGVKRAAEAFSFFAMFFLLCNVFIEGLLLRSHRAEVTDSKRVSKERESADTERRLTTA